ncbi:MAG: adenylate/guanylate cyclase domain-containing protein [Chitinophagaceae bacterium]
MNRELQLKIRQLGVITITWLVIGFFIALYDHLILHTNNSVGTTKEYAFGISLAINMGSGLIGALLGGSFLVFFVNVRYRDKPYGHTIIVVILSFILVIAIVALLISYISGPLLGHKPFLDTLASMAPRTLKSTIVWSMVVAITQLLLQVNNKFGQGVFLNVIRGKYNTPQAEERMFMFLDINSSTTIAEKLGDEKYHALLKDFFSDITTPIIENRGEIYQYVGDEVVIAWNYESGKENMHCIKCFFDMKLQIKKNEAKYLTKYGLMPSFKAGIHCGNVIAGEVGVLKRDITYSGNVLNTTSRILSKCSELKEELIASEDVISKLGLIKEYITRPLGAVMLKGKENTVVLNALLPAC